MSKAGFRNTYDLGKGILEVGLSIMIWEDPGGIHYCYSPALDLTGYGNTEQDAKKSFEHTLEDFVSYTNNKKTIFEELERLGWTVNKKKKRAQPPSEEQLLEDNENYQVLSNRDDVRKENTKVELAF